MEFEVKVNNDDFKLKINNGVVESISHKHIFFNESNLKKISNTIRVIEKEDNIQVKLKDTLIAEFDKKKKSITEFPITNFSLKNILFSNNIENVEIKQIDNRYTPKTDLHTHFGGILSSRELIDIGIEKDLEIPRFVAKKIRSKKEENLKFSDLTSSELDHLDTMLSIPIDKQSTFIDMEEIYKYRSFIIKNEDLFPDIMMKIADKYKKENIEYAEISLSNVTEPSYIEKINELVPKIYKEKGVLITFMAALWRHSDEPWNQYELEKLKKCAHNPYIVGLDIMGQETNSILDMRDLLVEFGKHIKEIDPKFNFRIHAGENLTRPENIRESLNIAKEAGVNIRIGHGIYGVDDEVINLALETNAVIEFNLNSNLSLNNIEGYANYVNRYSSRGVNCVFGSDGGGIYDGSAYDSMSVIDLSNDDIEKLKEFESNYIQTKKNQITEKRKNSNAYDIPESTSATEAITRCEQIANEKQKRITGIVENLKERKIQMHSEEELLSYTANKNVTLFSGASRSSWPLLSDKNQIEIERFVKELIDDMDSKKDVIITGGTDYGVEKIVHEYAYKKGIHVIGTLTEDAKIEEIKDNTISSAIMLGSNWYDKHSHLIKMLSKLKNKTSVFIAGGDIVSTEIQAFKNWNQKNTGSKNIRTRLMSLDNLEGASSIKAQSTPEYAFSNIRDFNSDIEYPQIDVDKISDTLSTLLSNNTPDRISQKIS